MTSVVKEEKQVYQTKTLILYQEDISQADKRSRHGSTRISKEINSSIHCHANEILGTEMVNLQNLKVFSLNHYTIHSFMKTVISLLFKKKVSDR